MAMMVQPPVLPSIGSTTNYLHVKYFVAVALADCVLGLLCALGLYVILCMYVHTNCTLRPNHQAVRVRLLPFAKPYVTPT